MKKALERVQNKASDEQKLFFAMLASISVAVLLFVIWFAGLQADIKSVNSNKPGSAQKVNTNSELQDEKEIKGQNEAGVLGALGDSFYSLTQKQGATDSKEQKENEIKRQPFKLEI